jgi:hypothetical protein
MGHITQRNDAAPIRAARHEKQDHSYKKHGHRTSQVSGTEAPSMLKSYCTALESQEFSRMAGFFAFAVNIRLAVLPTGGARGDESGAFMQVLIFSVLRIVAFAKRHGRSRPNQTMTHDQPSPPSCIIAPARHLTHRGQHHSPPLLMGWLA